MQSPESFPSPHNFDSPSLSAERRLSSGLEWTRKLLIITLGKHQMLSLKVWYVSCEIKIKACVSKVATFILVL